jgi:riboflavin transporter FmnP
LVDREGSPQSSKPREDVSVADDSAATFSSAGTIPRSREIALVGVFGALSIILSVVSNSFLKIAFVPPVSYLLFDFGEIPVVLCFFVVGPRAGFSAAVVELIALNLLPSSAPILGPLLKFMAVGSTLLGLWLSWVLVGRSPRAGFRLKFVTAASAAVVSRVVVMTVANAIYLIEQFGVTAGHGLYVLLWLTAAFNALHVPFDLIPAFAILNLPQMKSVLRSSKTLWFEFTRNRI